MCREARPLIPVLVTLMLAGCSINVPVHKVYGIYKAFYPFGTETITLNRDGSFVQEVAINQEQPVRVQGKWEFDDRESRANFYGALVVTDGFGHLRKDWRTVSDGLVSLDIERYWFRVVMG
jgi:hypothetical protein